MKRNETILVYGVTGLLAVILVVAVTFGSGTNPGAPGKGKGLTLGEVLNDSTPKKDGNPAKSETAKGEPDASKTGASGDKVGGAPKTAGLNDAGPSEAAAKETGSVPLSSSAPKPALPEMLGASRRDGEYRIVTAQQGDTFSGLVQKWCGTERLAVAEALNEDLDKAHLPAGREVCLPWVDDAVLVEAYQKRLHDVLQAAPMDHAANGEPASHAGASAASHGAEPRPAALHPKGTDVAAAGQDVVLYQVKPGDSLWAIAARNAGRKQAPQYIETLRTLNPDTLQGSDLLRAGAMIKLPKK